MLTDIIYRRLEESFKFVHLIIKKAGYDRRLPAGVVITGGTSQTKGIEKIAEEVFKLPVRIGKPIGITGLVDQIQGPAYSSSIGTLKLLADSLRDETKTFGRRNGNIGGVKDKVISFLKSFLP